MSWDDETLRFPSHLDQAAIVARLVKLRQTGEKSGLAEFVEILAGVEAMPPAQLGMSIIAAITWLEDKPEHKALAGKMEMLAVNLKNLK